MAPAAPDGRTSSRPPSRPDDDGATGLLARQASDHLAGDQPGLMPGLMLVGPETRTALVIRLLLDRLDATLLLPVIVDARGATPESLRDAVETRHAARPLRETGLLLVIPDAGRLSGEMRQELEQAAEAAKRHGGLKFLLAHTSALGPSFRDSGLPDLSDCLSTELAVPAARDDTQSASATRTTQENRTANAATVLGAAPGPGAGGRNPALLVLLGGAILAGLFLVIWMILRSVNTPPSLPPSQIEPRRAVPAPNAEPSPAPAPVPAAPPAPMPAPTPAPVSPAPTMPAAPALPEPSAPMAAPPPTTPQAATPSPAPTPTPQDGASLLLVAQPGDTLPVLYAKVYAGVEPPPFPQVKALNPVVRPGIRLVFPAPPAGWSKEPPPKP